MAAIPVLTRAHVEAALAQIDQKGVPSRRESKRYQLMVRGKRYPPKYVISLAAAHATGRELPSEAFSGGDETNEVLQSLGFIIEGRGTEGPGTAALRGRSKRRSQPVPRDEWAQDIVRVVVQGKRPSSPRAASKMLLEAFEQRWPAFAHARFTITPGGFVVGKFPARWRGGVGWGSRRSDLDALASAAQPLIEQVATKRVLDAARTRTRMLTVGIDLVSDAEHAELVAVIDCDSGNVVCWTGKSYPVGAQANNLVQVVDLSSHFIELAGERVLVLACHDLNMFSARARANQDPKGVRRKRCDDMNRLVARFRPTIVLQHPHSTDTPKVWRVAWSCLTRDYPSVRTWASGIAYYASKGPPRRSLREVLDGTRSETGVLDVTVKSR